ncbi:hypothetical protein GCM10027176_54080 [Actinoallomurus bryophytorum]
MAEMDGGSALVTVRPERHPPLRRFETDHAAARRGDPERLPPVDPSPWIKGSDAPDAGLAQI